METHKINSRKEDDAASLFSNHKWNITMGKQKAPHPSLLELQRPIH